MLAFVKFFLPVYPGNKISVSSSVIWIMLSRTGKLTASIKLMPESPAKVWVIFSTRLVMLFVGVDLLSGVESLFVAELLCVVELLFAIGLLCVVELFCIV